MDGLEAVLADVLTAEPEESLPHAHREPSKGALHLLRRTDFRLTYAAIATSELVGLMPAGAAVEAAGTLLRIEGFDSRHVLELRLLDD